VKNRIKLVSQRLQPHQVKFIIAPKIGLQSISRGDAGQTRVSGIESKFKFMALE
jgi:hypothetical protein